MADGELDLRNVRYGHPDAVALTGEAQAYYRSIYSGEDTNPLEAEEFAPPAGGFLVGYLVMGPDAGPDVGPDAGPDVAVAMGGWRSYPGDPPLGAHPAEIRRMFLRPAYRRRGFARRLLLALERDAAAAGADAMVLETGTPQTAALAFYTRQGYRPVPAFGHWAGWDDAVHLGRLL